MKKYEVGARTLPTYHATVTQDRWEPAGLLPGGLSRFNDIKPYLPVSRETWRLLGKAKRAPQPIRIKPRCTVWHNDEVIAWLANPTTFTVEG
ncbi:transcriptional regulator [Paraburkholderia nemoris]|uniref:helix-turn-helix transcriptional regulator n=1 Tax=Paraburkholderia nemoris TaxID=2793076 RepID=UPI0038BB3A12